MNDYRMNAAERISGERCERLIVISRSPSRNASSHDLERPPHQGVPRFGSLENSQSTGILIEYRP
jgi:hypothetical protein